jgi:hypothetical protein
VAHPLEDDPISLLGELGLETRYGILNRLRLIVGVVEDLNLIDESVFVTDAQAGARQAPSERLP